ncbi:MAG: class I SAM-dependent methyltransferase [Eubacteriales bacterium]|nr:class I SAM-dependent methyltransferase [Eubacteriales bacterium]
MPLEKMNEFFNTRADTYDHHMLVDLALDVFYEEIANCVQPDKPIFKLLDVGCGTGIELKRLYEKHPNMSVTGIDLSPEMLRQLREKYPDKKIELICGSYFDAPFENDFDVVLSTYSLHHWNETEKLKIYKKCFDSLIDNGIFINGDYTCKTAEQEQNYQSELVRLRQEENLTDNEFYHYDIPLTAETETKLLYAAGFVTVELVKAWGNTSILIARK